MLIDFRTLFPKYDIKPKGVLHIGGNVGEEFPVYMELGIMKQVWFEPNPEMFKKLKETISSNPNAHALPYCIGDENKKVTLHISNNAGQSSSILELGTHKEVHPTVYYTGDIEVDMWTVEALFGENSAALPNELHDVDFLNIDIQGAELMALKGMGEMLHQFKWAYLEVNKAELYVGCPLIEDIDAYLSGFGFVRVETQWAGNTNWGDAIFVKQAI